MQGGIDVVTQDGTVAILLMRGSPQFPALLIAFVTSAAGAAALGYAVLPLLRALKAAQVPAQPPYSSDGRRPVCTARLQL